MCLACNFQCCALDEFEGCGCADIGFCNNPACYEEDEWDDDDNEPGWADYG